MSSNIYNDFMILYNEVSGYVEANLIKDFFENGNTSHFFINELFPELIIYNKQLKKILPYAEFVVRNIPVDNGEFNAELYILNEGFTYNLNYFLQYLRSGFNNGYIIELEDMNLNKTKIFSLYLHDDDIFKPNMTTAKKFNLLDEALNYMRKIDIPLVCSPYRELHIIECHKAPFTNRHITIADVGELKNNNIL